MSKIVCERSSKVFMKTTPTSKLLFLYRVLRHTASETLHGLPYLDKVVHESLRLEAPVPFSSRVATSSAVVPLDSPVRGRNGKLITELQLSKGDLIAIRE